MKWTIPTFLFLAFAAVACSGGSESATADDDAPTPAAQTDPGSDQDETPEGETPPSTTEPEAEPEPVDEVDDPPVEAEAEAADAKAETTVAAVDGPIEEILADRVRGYFAAREAANAAPEPDPDHPGLSEFAVAGELAAVVEKTAARRDAGQAIRAGEEALAKIAVGFVDAGASAATLAACSIDDGVIFDVETGAVVNDEVLTHNYRIDLELHDGIWKVATIVRVQQWEGVAGCALAESDYPY